MKDYIKLYNTDADLIAEEGGENIILHTPGVGTSFDIAKTHFNQLLEDRLVVTYIVTSTTAPTTLFNSSIDASVIASMRIDTGEIIPVASAYTFDKIGYRTVFYEMTGTSLPASFFEEITTIISAQLPKKIKSVGGRCFRGTTKMEEIYFHPEGLVGTFGAYRTFSHSGIKRLVMPTGITTIANSALYDSYSLTALTISPNATTTASQAFENLTSLKKLVIPEKLASYGTKTFAGMSRLEEIWVKRMTAPNVVGNLFAGTKSGGVIHAPLGATGYENWINQEGESSADKLNGWTIVYDN